MQYINVFLSTCSYLNILECKKIVTMSSSKIRYGSYLNILECKTKIKLKLKK